MSDLYPPVASADDLIGRCRVATERKIAAASVEPGDMVHQLGLARPAAATNVQLK